MKNDNNSEKTSHLLAPAAVVAVDNTVHRVDELLRMGGDAMKKYHDERFMYTRMLIKSMAEENERQLMKWGIQERTLPEWMLYLTEEVGELAEAIAEFVYRGGSSKNIYKEAIQCAVLSAKIAEMIEIQEGGE